MQNLQNKLKKPNLPNQAYQTKPTKLNLLNQTELRQASLLNQTYQTLPTKSNQNYWLKQSTPGSVVPLKMFMFVLVSFVYKKNQSEKYEKHNRAGRLAILKGNLGSAFGGGRIRRPRGKEGL